MTIQSSLTLQYHFYSWNKNWFTRFLFKCFAFFVKNLWIIRQYSHLHRVDNIVINQRTKAIEMLLGNKFIFPVQFSPFRLDLEYFFDGKILKISEELLNDIKPMLLSKKIKKRKEKKKTKRDVQSVKASIQTEQANVENSEPAKLIVEEHESPDSRDSEFVDQQKEEIIEQPEPDVEEFESAKSNDPELANVEEFKTDQPEAAYVYRSIYPSLSDFE